MMWGINGVQEDGGNMWNAEEPAPLEWDNSFDLSSDKAQQHLYDLCTYLKSEEAKVSGLVSNGWSNCFMDAFKTYVTTGAYTGSKYYDFNFAS
jgi:hypothetical protein